MYIGRSIAVCIRHLKLCYKELSQVAYDLIGFHPDTGMSINLSSQKSQLSSSSGNPRSDVLTPFEGKFVAPAISSLRAASGDK